jgi:hypothetical protein
MTVVDKLASWWKRVTKWRRSTPVPPTSPWTVTRTETSRPLTLADCEGDERSSRGTPWLRRERERGYDIPPRGGW